MTKQGETSKQAKPKRQKPKVFDFFAMRLRDGSYGLGQFIGMGPLDEKIGVFYRTRAALADELRARLDAVTLDDAIGRGRFGTHDLEKGEWPILGNQDPARRGYLARIPAPGPTLYSGEIFDQFLEAYHGLRSWNDHPMAATWFREILLPHLDPPPQEGVPLPVT